MIYVYDYIFLLQQRYVSIGSNSISPVHSDLLQYYIATLVVIVSTGLIVLGGLGLFTQRIP